MNEASIKRDLVKVLKQDLSGAVIIRHEDKFKAGVPDLSVTWSGVTSWIEVKYDRVGRTSRLTALQSKMLYDIARGAGAPAYLLVYSEGQDRQRETILIRWGRVGGFNGQARTWLHHGVAAALRRDHEEGL